MPKESKVTVKTVVPSEVYKRLGPITRETSAARHELRELPITYIESRGTPTAALVPPWLAQWAEKHADELFASLSADETAS